MRTLVILIAILLLCGFFYSIGTGNPNERAETALDDAGFSSIELTGLRWLGCGEHDFWRVGFKALNAQGKTVTGVVCIGTTKGSTIRFD